MPASWCWAVHACVLGGGMCPGTCVCSEPGSPQLDFPPLSQETPMVFTPICLFLFHFSGGSQQPLSHSHPPRCFCFLCGDQKVCLCKSSMEASGHPVAEGLEETPRLCPQGGGSCSHSPWYSRIPPPPPPLLPGQTLPQPGEPQHLAQECTGQELWRQTTWFHVLLPTLRGWSWRLWTSR